MILLIQTPSNGPKRWGLSPAPRITEIGQPYDFPRSPLTYYSTCGSTFPGYLLEARCNLHKHVGLPAYEPSHVHSSTSLCLLHGEAAVPRYWSDTIRTRCTFNAVPPVHDKRERGGTSHVSQQTNPLDLPRCSHCSCPPRWGICGTYHCFDGTGLRHDKQIWSRTDIKC